MPMLISPSEGHDCVECLEAAEVDVMVAFGDGGEVTFGLCKQCALELGSVIDDHLTVNEEK